MLLSTTQFWMLGIMALMAAFGVCAGIFSSLGKKDK